MGCLGDPALLRIPWLLQGDVPVEGPGQPHVQGLGLLGPLLVIPSRDTHGLRVRRGGGPSLELPGSDPRSSRA